MITEAKREAVHRKIDLFLNQLTNGKADALKPYLYEIIDAVMDEAQELHQRKADSSDLRELIIEMREGFKRMDARFEQMEKRFEQIDKRFETIDARFNRLYHFLMWMMGVIATGFFGLYLKLFFLK
jgi:acyl carrier protein phosphodiesterase